MTGRVMLPTERAQRYCPRINKQHKENIMSQGATTPASNDQNVVPMTPGKGLLVLLGVIVVIGSFIALGSALGLKQFWIAFLFLLYWTGVEHAAFDKLLACVVGAVAGLALAWSLSLLPAWFGEKHGMICFGLLILVTVYCQIMGWLPVVVNLATMLFLTVGTIPPIHEHLDYVETFKTLALGFVYFIGLVWIGTFVMAKRATAQAA